MPRTVRYTPVLGYYIGKKTLAGAKKLGDSAIATSQSADDGGPQEATAAG
jgi:hypothetical protein